MALDVTWEPESREAGWIQPWTGTTSRRRRPRRWSRPSHRDWQASSLRPDNSNTALLWTRSDLANPAGHLGPDIDDSIQLAKEGKPHLIEIQGAQYEGATVWFNTMLASAGGSVLTANAQQAALGQPALTALSIMKKARELVAADPSLDVQMENDNRLAMEAGKAAFD